MLNQGTMVPSNLEKISIVKRRGLFGLFTNIDGHATAYCKTSKGSIIEWIKFSDFEVIHCLKDTSSDREFYTSFESLPQKILDNNVEFIVQLKRQSSESRMIEVAPVDDKNVLLKYEMNWN